MGTPSDTDQLDSEIFEAMGQLIEGVIGKFEQLAQNFGVPAFCVSCSNFPITPSISWPMASKISESS